MPRSRLRTGSLPPLSERSFIGVAVLLGLICAAILVEDPFAHQVKAAPAHAGLHIPSIGTTTIPLPPSRFGFEASAGQGKGEVIFSRGRVQLSAGDAGMLFQFYLSTMRLDGWTVGGRAGPSRAGEWTLHFTKGARQATLSLYQSPRSQLTVDDCPPFPYC